MAEEDTQSRDTEKQACIRADVAREQRFSRPYPRDSGAEKSTRNGDNVERERSRGQISVTVARVKAIAENDTNKDVI